MHSLGSLGGFNEVEKSTLSIIWIVCRYIENIARGSKHVVIFEQERRFLRIIIRCDDCGVLDKESQEDTPAGNNLHRSLLFDAR
ncbi:MAG: hypothetical protein ThorAB25_13040 [Candidatus Thorarchaeota archaeon AB_25]|nr:MAG: hypothetical protein ThorAB25_13040 [Candidatus Thorarchaeota archaeon AB_25]